MSNKIGNHLNLKIGDKIKIGKKCAARVGLKKGEIIELIEGFFEYDNGLYSETQTAPSIESDDGDDDSIFHLFGNNLEDFLDSEIIK
ncbi:MAG TPA: hypothetical protein VMW95_08995 [Desulfobacterales bacterium]|nr:hypothetical protein [Desulfobacterales bacterium]